jgi:hypothetical protein
LREFECTLCQRRFTLLSADLMLPQPAFCDECLKALWGLDAAALTRHVSGCLKENASGLGKPYESHAEEQADVNNTVQHFQWHKVQWNSPEELIRNREQARQASGSS